MSLTQADLARLTGRSRAMVSNYLSGRLAPSFQVMQRLGEVLRLNMNWVFYGEGSMFRGQEQEPRSRDGLPAHRGPSCSAAVRVAEELAGYWPEEAGHGAADSDAPVRPENGPGPCPGRAEGPEASPASEHETVSRAALDAHRELLQMAGNVCDILAESGVEAEVISRIAAELVKMPLKLPAR
jgi:transcriptional regulator with XRE-family HTH domain